MNFALFHCLGPSIQTALLNAPLVVIVGWCLDKNMNLNFEIFMIVLLILAILVVGNFLRDGKSNYLEGALCVLVYIIIAVSTWYYPNPRDASSNTNETGGTATGTPSGEGASATAEATAAAAEHLIRMLMK
jgi:Ca2+:H+ antiporter